MLHHTEGGETPQSQRRRGHFYHQKQHVHFSPETNSLTLMQTFDRTSMKQNAPAAAAEPLRCTLDVNRRHGILTKQRRDSVNVSP
jgi:hypothetical protein